MPYTSTLTALIAEVRTRTDTTGSTFVTDAEITGYINRGVAKWQQLVISNGTQEYFFTSRSFNTAAGTSVYAIEDVNNGVGFFKLLGVTTTINGNVLTLRPFMRAERNIFNVNTAVSWGDTDAVYYRLRGTNIEFIPTPNGVYPITLEYIPTPTILSTGGTTSIDGIASWDEYAVLDASQKVAVKKRQPELAQFLAAEKAELAQIIVDMASNRDMGMPERVTDTTGWAED